MTQGHADKMPDRRNAEDAGEARRAGEAMQHLAVDHAAPLSRRTARGDDMSHTASESQHTKSAVDAEDRKPHSVQAQQSQPGTQIETTLAHRAALNRLNGVDSRKPATDNSSSSARAQPVLVKSYSGAQSAKKADMAKRRRASIEPPELPSLESFSFHDILKEIDPDIRVSIDAIAEIYGRSKLSLADEYGSHRPPQGGLEIFASPDQTDTMEAMQSSRLEPVEESTPGHARRHSLALVGISTQPKSGLSSNAVAATSNAISIPQQRRQSASLPPNSPADTKVALLPYVMSWLRNARSRSQSPSSQLSSDPRAADSLHRILGDG